MRRFTMLVLCCVAAATSPARAAIPQDPDATTSADYRHIYTDWATRTMVDAYRQSGPRDERWDERVEATLADAAHYWSGLQPKPDKETLYKQCADLVAEGCTEPMVSYMAVTYSPGSYTEEQLQQLETSLRNMTERGYPAYYQHLCAYTLWRAYAKRDRDADAARCFHIAADCLVQAIQPDQLKPEELGALYRQVEDRIENIVETDGELARQLAQKLDAADTADPWLRHTMLGQFHVKAAWAARGSGWASSVTQAGWKGFGEHLRAARRHLEEAWRIDPKRPEAPALMLTVCLGDSNEPVGEGRLWFERAVKAQFDYEPAYDSYEWLLRPRWFGSHEQMAAFGLECVRTKRFDTDVPWELIDVMQAVRKDEHNAGGYGSIALWRRPDVYAQMQAVFVGYRDSPDRTSSREWFDSQSAAVAYRCGHYDEAYKLISELGDKAEAGAFTRFGTTLDEARAGSAAEVGPLAPQIAAAHELAMRSNFSGSLSAYQALLQTPDLDPGLHRLLETRAIALRQIGAYRDGDVVDLLVPPDLAGWIPLRGTWEAGENDTLVGKSDATGMIAVSGTKFAPPWQLSGRVSFEATGAHPAEYAVVALGGNDDNLVMPCIEIDPRYDHVRLSLLRDDTSTHTSVDVELTGEPVDFRIRHHGDSVSVWIGDQQVMNHERFDELETAGTRIGFGADIRHTGHTYRFDQLRIRRLTDEENAPMIPPTPVPQPQRRPGPPPSPISAAPDSPEPSA